MFHGNYRLRCARNECLGSHGWTEPHRQSNDLLYLAFRCRPLSSHYVNYSCRFVLCCSKPHLTKNTLVSKFKENSDSSNTYRSKNLVLTFKKVMFSVMVGAYLTRPNKTMSLMSETGIIFIQWHENINQRN